MTDAYSGKCRWYVHCIHGCWCKGQAVMVLASPLGCFVLTILSIIAPCINASSIGIGIFTRSRQQQQDASSIGIGIFTQSRQQQQDASSIGIGIFTRSRQQQQDASSIGIGIFTQSRQQQQDASSIGIGIFTRSRQQQQDASSIGIGIFTRSRQQQQDASSIGIGIFTRSRQQQQDAKSQTDLQASASLGKIGVTVHPMHAVHVHSKSAAVSRSEPLLGGDAAMPAVEVFADNLLDIATLCACIP